MDVTIAAAVSSGRMAAQVLRDLNAGGISNLDTQHLDFSIFDTHPVPLTVLSCPLWSKRLFVFEFITLFCCFLPSVQKLAGIFAF